MQNTQYRISGLVKSDIYKLVLTYSSDELVKGNVYFIDRNLGKSICKVADKLNKSQRLTKTRIEAMKAGLKAVQKVSTMIEKLSHEMLTYIALDFLLNVEKDTTIRVIFGHIDTKGILDKIEIAYPKELLEHYKFFNTLVDCYE